MSGARPSMGLVAYQGLILDFGGVVTTDFHGALAAFCVREGLAPDAVSRALETAHFGHGSACAEDCAGSGSQIGGKIPHDNSTMRA